MTDVETTGTDPGFHEIIEIALLLVDQTSLQVIDRLSEKVRPKHLERATAHALAVNGYKPSEWADAIPLDDALRRYAKKTRGAIFCSHNVTFDWAFLHEAFRTTKVQHSLDYHRLDLFTIAWTVLRGRSTLSDFNLSKVGAYLGIGQEATPHRAANGAEYAYQVLKRLLDCELIPRKFH